MQLEKCLRKIMLSTYSELTANVAVINALKVAWAPAGSLMIIWSFERQWKVPGEKR